MSVSVCMCVCVCVCVCARVCVCVCEGNSTHGSACKCMCVVMTLAIAIIKVHAHSVQIWPAALVIWFLLCSSSWLKTLLTQFTSHTSGWLSTHAQISMNYILQVACAVIGMHSTVWVTICSMAMSQTHAEIGSRNAWLNQWKVKGQRYSKGCSQQSHWLRNTTDIQSLVSNAAKHNLDGGVRGQQMKISTANGHNTGQSLTLSTHTVLRICGSDSPWPIQL